MNYVNEDRIDTVRHACDAQRHQQIVSNYLGRGYDVAGASDPYVATVVKQDVWGGVLLNLLLLVTTLGVGNVAMWTLRYAMRQTVEVRTVSD